MEFEAVAYRATSDESESFIERPNDDVKDWKVNFTEAEIRKCVGMRLPIKVECKVPVPGECELFMRDGDRKNLWVRGRLDPNSELAKHVYKDILWGSLREISLDMKVYVDSQEVFLDCISLCESSRIPGAVITTPDIIW